MSSKGPTVMPWRFSTSQSYFMFWPILRTVRSSGPASRAASASPIGIWPAMRPPPNSGIAAVLERDIGRASGLEGEGDAGESACMGSSEVVSVSRRRSRARVLRPARGSGGRDPDRLVSLDVEGQRGGGRRDLAGEERGRADPLLRPAQRPPAGRGRRRDRPRPSAWRRSRRRTAAPRQGTGSPFSGRRQVIASPPGMRRGSGSIARGRRRRFTTRRVSALNSRAFRKATSAFGSGFGTRSASTGTGSGASQSRVTSRFESRALSAFSIRVSRRFGCLISDAQARSVRDRRTP